MAASIEATGATELRWFDDRLPTAPATSRPYFQMNWPTLVPCDLCLGKARPLIRLQEIEVASDSPRVCARVVHSHARHRAHVDARASAPRRQPHHDVVLEAEPAAGVRG